MAYVNTFRFAGDQPTILPNGAIMVGAPTVLFDGKCLEADDTDLWHTVGTGTFTFTNASMVMSVTAGQYVIRQSRRFLPYISGFPQCPEFTYENSTTQAGVVKRFGYASCAPVAPYNTIMDGWWLEDDGTGKHLKAANAGTLTIDVPATSWDNYAAVASYDYSFFTVTQMYIVWLGGAAYQFYMAVPDKGFTLIHSGEHAGVRSGTVTRSPNQPLFYSIHSSTGTGTFTAICSQCFTAGAVAQSGKADTHRNVTPVACNATNFLYALLGLKKVAARRHISVKLTDMGVVNTATTDSGVLVLVRNPTLTAPLTYTTVGNLQKGVPGSVITVSAGQELFSVPVSSSGVSLRFETEMLTWVTHGIDDTMDEYALCYQPNTTNQNVNGVINCEYYV